MAVAGAVIAVAAAAQADETDAGLISEAHATIATFKKTDPGLAAFFERAPGYVVFPSIGKGAVGIGGAHGDGIVFQHGKPIGRASMTQVTVGLQVGGQAYAEVIFFQAPADLARFTQGNFEFSGQASAVALKAGASANARYQNGVAIFTATRGGLMLEASVGGQKFDFKPFARK